MMPDLGTYATEVLLAYALSLALLGGLVLWVWARARRTKSELDRLEARLNRSQNGQD